MMTVRVAVWTIVGVLWMLIALFWWMGMGA